ncbi:MAG TPA: ABC transporter permease [Chromatiales bacterium]|jgi:ABC-2 type transport system permease protein|nr:ABC transporter permease [Chromatiales bacterium]HIO54368.1 ABC transporter permease [Chromatiales bacterium]
MGEVYNPRGMRTLFEKEVRRFLKVSIQTVLAPCVTTLLYLLVFASVLEDHIKVYDGVSYLAFLVPGLIMMTVIQNAFANASSSLIQSKMTGNLVFLLLSPISGVEMVVAFVAAAVVRGILVGLCVWLVALVFVDVPLVSLTTVLLFLVLSSAVLGAVGLIAGLWADKFDQLSAFQNFIIVPLSFLSGVFYSVESLPDIWQAISRFNPFFYMIDGFRYGFFGVSDVDPELSLVVTLAFLLLVSGVSLLLVRIGYKIRQ